MDQRRQERAPLDALVLPGLPAQRRAPPTRALAYNIANFLRTLALSKEIEQWSLTPLCVKLVGISARIVRHGRSEEHTSELQSQMRITYDVFCLKKKKKVNSKTTQLSSNP